VSLIAFSPEFLPGKTRGIIQRELWFPPLQRKQGSRTPSFSSLAWTTHINKVDLPLWEFSEKANSAAGRFPFGLAGRTKASVPTQDDLRANLMFVA
jgi:hypothetical protein